MGNTTVIYYSSNRENELFEKRITEILRENCGGLPIISVTQKPMDLGQNICVGEHVSCYSNEWKQILIGLKSATTEFCIAAESDCVYPPDYFSFTPPVSDLVYRYANVWVHWVKRSTKFFKKPRCEGAQICGREYWIERLEEVVGWHKGWEKMEEDSGLLVEKIFPPKEGRWTGDPVVTFKTGSGVSNKTSLKNIPPVRELPYWGTVDNIYKRVFV